MGKEREISGKVFIITGAAGGLGAAFTEAFIEEGAKFVAILDVDVEQGRTLEGKLNSKHGSERALFIPCDVSEEDQLSAAYAKVLERCGRIDVVINNAGILCEKAHTKVIQVNLMAVVSSSYRALDVMRADEAGSGGTIINVSSLAGLIINHYTPTYCATKVAVLAFSNSLGMSAHYKRTKVRVLAICSGATDTNILKNPEERSYDEATCVDFAQFDLFTQRVESVVAGMLTMFKNGVSGSTWLVSDDNPVMDITSNVDNGRLKCVENYPMTWLPVRKNR